MAQAPPAGGGHTEGMKAPLPALLLAVSASVASANDAGFAGAVADVQALTQAAAAQASWSPRDWFRSEPARPSRIPDDGVEAGGIRYFLDGGRVFETVPGSGQAAHLEGSSKVKALAVYRDALMALRENGNIYVWTPKRNWVSIGNSAVSMLVAGDDLLALTRSGEVWAYLGAPGSLRITYIFIPQRIGDVTILQPYPVVDGRRVAFSDTGIHGVARLEPDGSGGARVIRRDGSSAPYVRGR